MTAQTPAEAAVTAWLAGHQDAMIALLRDLVNTDSGSYDKAGVDAAGAVLARFFAQNGMEVQWLANATHGDAVQATLPSTQPERHGANDQRPVLLLGHRDTVFPKGEPERRPFTIQGKRAFGPGVADMKAGLVINAFVAAALGANRANSRPIRCLITSDEEIASPDCRPHIEAAAREALCVFNSEPSRTPKGTVTSGGWNEQHQIITKGRKGGVFMRLDVTGKAAHSGARYEQGISAIVDLATKIPALQALTDLKAGTTVNVGLIGGGQTVNTIAPHAWCEIDLRYVDPPQRSAMIDAIRTIAEAPAVPGTQSALTIKGEFLPLVETAEAKAMFEVYRTAAGAIGFEVSAAFSGGCADSGFTSAMGCPTLCSVGPAGGGGHTPEEWIEIDSLVPCAQALALTVMRVGNVLPSAQKS
ncbi:MAG: M20 family metallopeptidase [Beijerinckiaceae bacterium]